jgi:polar amino acid transport system ATP-binding protein
MSEAPRLELDGVHKRFGSKVVLDGIDLVVGEHEVVCLIGPSGCGKSTLLRCVDLLERIEQGRILLDGRDVTARGVDANAVRKRMAIVFQSFNLFPHLSVLDNITLAPRKAHGVKRTDAEREGRELLGRFGLADKADEYPERLSGGQQQRVGIARALAQEPKLILFDEPTSALDPELVGEVLGVIHELADEGRTMVMVTHEIRFAREVADEVVFMDEGLVVEQGPPAQVIDRPAHERTRRFLGQLQAG